MNSEPDPELIREIVAEYEATRARVAAAGEREEMVDLDVFIERALARRRDGQRN